MNTNEAWNKTQGKNKIIGLKHTCRISIDFLGYISNWKSVGLD